MSITTKKLLETDPLTIAQMILQGHECSTITTCEYCPFNKSEGNCELACDSAEHSTIIQNKIAKLSKIQQKTLIKEETVNTESVGIKHDQEKPRVGYMFEQFSLALMAVAEVATKGAEEYGEGNWQYVESKRYENAMCRHLLQKGYDDKSGLLHKAHRAWNALATLELELRKKGKNNV